MQIPIRCLTEIQTSHGGGKRWLFYHGVLFYECCYMYRYTSACFFCFILYNTIYIYVFIYKHVYVHLVYMVQSGMNLVRPFPTTCLMWSGFSLMAFLGSSKYGSYTRFAVLFCVVPDLEPSCQERLEIWQLNCLGLMAIQCTKVDTCTSGVWCCSHVYYFRC